MSNPNSTINRGAFRHQLLQFTDALQLLLEELRASADPPPFDSANVCRERGRRMYASLDTINARLNCLLADRAVWEFLGWAVIHPETYPQLLAIKNDVDLLIGSLHRFRERLTFLR